MRNLESAIATERAAKAQLQVAFNQQTDLAHRREKVIKQLNSNFAVLSSLLYFNCTSEETKRLKNETQRLSSTVANMTEITDSLR